MSKAPGVDYKTIYKERPFFLPKRQFEVLQSIFRGQHFSGLTPSMEEIAKRVGLKNKMTVKQHIDALRRKGYIEMVPNTPREYRIPNHIRAILRYWL